MGLWFDKMYMNYTRSVLVSSISRPKKFLKWVKDEESFNDWYQTACTGDAGGALLYWDKHGSGEIFLIGMVTGTRMWNKCGYYGVDMAISMLSLVGWLSQFIEEVRNPLLRNEDLIIWGG